MQSVIVRRQCDEHSGGMFLIDLQLLRSIFFLLSLLLMSTSTLGAGDKFLSVISCSMTRYPRIALQARVSGRVEVSAKLGEGGAVVEAHATTGHPILREAVEKSLVGWRLAALECSSKVEDQIKGCKEFVYLPFQERSEILLIFYFTLDSSPGIEYEQEFSINMPKVLISARPPQWMPSR